VCKCISEPTLDKRLKGGGIEGACCRTVGKWEVENETMMVVALEIEHQFLDKDQKLHLTHESLMTLQTQMTKTEVHTTSRVEELLMGNEATMKILQFLVVNTLPHLAHAIIFPKFMVLQFAYNVCGW
jgi:hypothetical protein